MKRDSARDLEGTETQETPKSFWTRTKSEVENLLVDTNLNSELKGGLFKRFYICAIPIFAGLRSSLLFFYDLMRPSFGLHSMADSTKLWAESGFHLEGPGQVRELGREEFNDPPKVWDAISWNATFFFWGAVDLDYLLVCLKTLCGDFGSFSLITYNDISTIVRNVGEPTEIHFIKICSKYVLCCFPVMHRSSVYEQRFWNNH